MQIAIITTPREPSYVKETIQQIACSDIVTAEFIIEAFTDVPSFESWAVKTQTMHWTLQRRADALPRGYQRACLNFWNALTTGVGDLMLFEDDIAVKPGWQWALEAVRASSAADLVSLYWPDLAPFHDEVHGGPGDFQWREYRKPETFHGSLGLFVPGKHRYPLAAFIEAQMGPEMMPFDNLVARWLHTMPEVRMVATAEAQVDHRGDVSAITENRDHGPRRSPGW